MKSKPAAAPVTPVKWEERPLDWPRSTGQVDQVLEALKLRERRQRRRRITAAMSAALLVLGGLWLSADFRPATTNPPPAVVAAPTYRISSPERRTLPDGSVVDLQPGAELVVNFSSVSSGPRRVTLISGVAFFQVAKNAERPFIVTSGGVGFRAVGTAFSVKLSASEVEMIVTEGRVAIDEMARAANKPASAPIVSAGNSAVVDLLRAEAVPVITPMTQVDAGSKLAWRVPRLEFNETPLVEVVELLNRQSGNRLSLASADLGRVEISGALRADNIEPLLQMLEANYGILTVREWDGRIQLRRGK
jgi:transmembrane sensor